MVHGKRFAKARPTKQQAFTRTAKTTCKPQATHTGSFPMAVQTFRCVKKKPEVVKNNLLNEDVASSNSIISNTGDIIQQKFSSQHSFNIFFAFINIFMSNLSMYNVYGNIGTNIENLTKLTTINAAWILGISHIGYLLSTTTFNMIFKNDFKKVFIYHYFSLLLEILFTFFFLLIQKYVLLLFLDF